MSNLIPLEDAARMLGLSVDKLNEMRSNSEIFGYKDGTSWKFKMQEIERIADEMGVSLNAADAAEEIVELVDDAEDELSFELSDSGMDVISPESLDDEEEIQIVEDGASEAEQGVLDLVDDDVPVIEDEPVVELVDEESEEALSLADDDQDDVLELKIDDDEEFNLADSGELEIVDDADAVAASEDREPAEELEIASASDDFSLQDDSADALELAADDDELSLGSSDINLAGGDDDVAGSPDNTGDLLGSRLDDDFALASGPATGDLLAEDSGEDSGLLLSEDDLFEDDLKIHESHEDDIDLSSDFESSDLIMEDSESSEGSAVIGDEDSGFVLDDDSAEIELSGSLMELAGADDEEMIVLDEPAAADAGTDVADDDFNLTPLEEVVDEESSGSQIIALEDSEMFSDESAATLLSPSDELEAAPMMADDALDVQDFGGFDPGVAGMAPGVAVTPGGVGALPEQPYTLWQVASLGLVLFLMLVGGMVGYDLARNLWLPEGQTVSGGVLPLILNLVGV